jgi:hypothetical protein
MKYVSFALLAGLAVCLGCGGGGPVPAPTQPVTLAYRDLGGAPVDYEVDLSVTTDEGARTWVSTFDFSLKTEEITSDGGINRRFDFSDFAVTHYSGSTPEPDPDAPGYVGEYLTMKMDPDGNITDWKGLDGIHGPVPAGPRFKDAIVYLMFRMFQPPPREPINAGSTWQSTFETPLRIGGGEVTLKGTVDHEVDGFGEKAGRECVKIKTKIWISGVGDRKVGEDELPSFEHEEEGRGEVWWDYGSGVIAEWTTKTAANQTYRRERAGRTDVATTYSGVDYEMKVTLK